MTLNGFPFGLSPSTQLGSSCQEPETASSFSQFNLTSGVTTPSSVYMNNLIMNQKPLPPTTLFSLKLSKAAT